MVDELELLAEPTPHEKQAVAPGIPANLPGEHIWHCEEPTAELHTREELERELERVRDGGRDLGKREHTCMNQLGTADIRHC